MVKVKCSHCGYQWETKSKMIKVNCSSCRKSIKNIEVLYDE